MFSTLLPFLLLGCEKFIGVFCRLYRKSEQTSISTHHKLAHSAAPECEPYRQYMLPLTTLNSMWKITHGSELSEKGHVFHSLDILQAFLMCQSLCSSRQAKMKDEDDPAAATPAPSDMGLVDRH